MIHLVSAPHACSFVVSVYFRRQDDWHQDQIKRCALNLYPADVSAISGNQETALEPCRATLSSIMRRVEGTCNAQLPYMCRDCQVLGLKLKAITSERLGAVNESTATRHWP